MKKCKLGDLMEVTRGMSLCGEYYATEGDLMRLTLGNFDYRNNCFKDDKSKDNLFFSGDVKDEFILHKDDIITPLTEQAIGLLGSTAKIPCDGKYIQSQDVGLIRCNDKLCPDYAFYLIPSKVVRTQLSAAAQQTKIRHTSPDKIKDCTVWIPDYAEQEKIGKLLSSLDDKIALNRRINAKLEAMAKRLYDYWFVQFDFPFDFAQGKPNADGEFDYAHSPSDSRPNRNDYPPVAERSRGYKSSGGNMEYNATLKREIPAGWEVKRLGEVISKIDSGKRPAGGIDKSLTSGIPSLGAECIDELGVFDFSATPFIDFSYSEKMKTGKIENNDILIYKDGAYVGKTTLFRDNFPYKDAFVNEHVFLIHANKETLEEYLYFVLTQKTYFQIMQNLGKAKAAQPGLNREDLQNILLLIPSDDRVLAFHKKVEPLFAQIFNNAKTMGKLTALRDYLLPLLMNGQVSVDTDNVCEFCNAKLAKQVTSCDING